MPDENNEAMQQANLLNETRPDDAVAPEPKKRSRIRRRGKKAKKWVYDNLILVLTIIAVVIGVVVGIVVKANVEDIGEDTKVLIGFPGEILMRMLKCLIVPLITASLISGLSQLDLQQSAAMGRRALLYYFGTTFCAVVLGIILVVIIHPGDESIKAQVGQGIIEKKVTTMDAFLDLFRNLFPDNIIQATFMSTGTNYVTRNVTKRYFPEGGEPYFDTIEQEVRKVEMMFGMNMLGLIMFTIAFGIVLTRMGREGQVVVDFFHVINEIIMQLVMIVVWYSPIGIASLICGRIVEVDNLFGMLISLGRYMLTVVAGLIIHATVVLPLIYFIFTRRNPYVFLKGMLQAWVMALATASSSATMPFTFHCLEDNNGIDMRVTRFVIPIGATVNMDGTALYEAVAAIFIGQMNGLQMTIGKVITISLTATLASIGAASIPSAGLVTMMVVLTSVGLPVEDISLIVAVDWLLDRLRTSINVLGDSLGAGIVYYLSLEELKEMDQRRAEAGEYNPVNETDFDESKLNNKESNL